MNWMYVNLLVVAVVLAVYVCYWRLTRRRLVAQNVELETQNDLLETQNRELVVAKARTDETANLKQRFGQLMAREIKTPLQTIMGYSQVIDNFDIEISEADLHMMTRSITDNALRISRLVDNTLVLAESLSMHSIKRADRVSAFELAEQVSDLSGIRDARHLDFSIEAPGGVGETMLTTNRFYAIRALWQLFDNAMKFTRQSDSLERAKPAGSPPEQTVRLVTSVSTPVLPRGPDLS